MKVRLYALDIPKRVNVEAASGKGFKFNIFWIRNSGASSGDVVRKLRIQRGRGDSRSVL